MHKGRFARGAFLVAGVFSFLNLNSGSVSAIEDGFYRRFELPKRPDKDIHRAFFSTVHIQSSNPATNSGSSGSGILISPQGHILTALHVIEGAAEVMAFYQQRPAAQAGQIEIGYVNRTPDIILKNVSIPELGSQTPVRLVALGASRFLVEPPKDAKPGVPVEAAVVGSEREDYAILKVDMPYETNCIPVSKSAASLKKDDAVWHLGFPAKAFRKNKFGSDGFSKHIAYGSLISVQGESEKYLSPWGEMSGLAGSNADIVPGMSGGPAVDRNTDLIGISIFIKHNESDAKLGVSELPYYRSSGDRGNLLSIGLISKSLEKVLGQKQAQAILSCPENESKYEPTPPKPPQGMTFNENLNEVSLKDLSAEEYTMGVADYLREWVMAWSERGLLNTKDLQSKILPLIPVGPVAVEGQQPVLAKAVAEGVEEKLNGNVHLAFQESVRQLIDLYLQQTGVALEDIDLRNRPTYLRDILGFVIASGFSRATEKTLQEVGASMTTPDLRLNMELFYDSLPSKVKNQIPNNDLLYIASVAGGL